MITHACFVTSIRPKTLTRNISFARQLLSLKGISYGFVGERASLLFARQLVADLDGRVFRVPKEGKILYHLACVFASNYSVVLLGAVQQLVRGFTRNNGLKHFERLMSTSLENALSVSPSKALTGPIVRGSMQTIRMHLHELKKKNKDLLPLYRSLGMIALSLASKQKRLSKKQVHQMRKMLRSRSALSTDFMGLRNK